MAYQESYGRRAVHTTEEISGWAVGLTFFASMMMLLLGGFHIIAGLAAVIDDTFYVVRENYALEFDVTTWGWVHIVGGILVVLAGIGLLAGSVLARIVTILVASITILWNFYSIPYYPVWSILMIALAIGVIWALIAHGRDFETNE
jgi:hypothetical protein